MAEVSDASPDVRFQSQWRKKDRLLAKLDEHPFRAPPWLQHRHAQTIYGRLFRRPNHLPFRRERWTTPDDDFIDIDFIDGDPKRPTVIILHGLEGSTESPYMRGLNDQLHRMSWNTLNPHHRSCSGEINRAKRMYHSGETSDLDFIVRQLVESNPSIRLYVAGFSLGANVTAKWLGENGDNVPENVKAAGAISPPYDLTQSQPHVEEELYGLYVRTFLKRLIPKAVEKERQYPGVIDVEKVKEASTFKDFDDHATAPLHGFEDAEDYYRSVSCGQFLSGVRRPLALISAEDDPFNPGHSIPHETIDHSPWLIPQITRKGGHVGFVTGPGPWAARFWAEEQLARFFALCEELV